MPFSGDTFTKLYAWLTDPQRNEKIFNSRLDDEFGGVATGLTTLAGRATAVEAEVNALQDLDSREVLTANRTYYVRTDGSDSNDGLANTAGGAFLTIQKAVDTVASIDLSIYNVTIQVRSGTYTGAVVVNKPFIGSGTVTLQGDTSTPSNVVISTTSASCIVVQNGAALNVAGFKLQTTTSGSCLVSSTNAAITVTGLMDYGAAVSIHITASTFASINITANYTISGGASNHFFSQQFGRITFSSTSITVTLSGTPAFSGSFAFAQRIAFIFAGVVYSGSATGTRYAVQSNSIIDANGGGASALPGNAAGSTATQGLYI
jgi:hypothetical protein